jgi:AraC-like DNA-binding protein
MPNGHPELFFNLGDSDFLIYSKNYRLENTHSFVVGLHDAYFGSYILNRSPIHSFIITFKLFGLQRLLGIKESSLINHITDAKSHLNHLIDDTWQKLNQASSAEEMKSRVEDFLSLFEYHQPTDLEIEEATAAAKCICNNNGLLSIIEISHSIGIHRRKLERLFRNHIGLSPSEFSRIFRFEHLFTHAAKRGDLMDMVGSCGYYDQAHFIHDFKRVAGITPEFFLEVIKPNYYNQTETNRTYFPVVDEKILKFLPKS